MVKVALSIDDLLQYHQGKEPFVGSQTNGLKWWENLPITAREHPLKLIVITLFSIVPHAAKVEQLFLALGGTQTVKQCKVDS